MNYIDELLKKYKNELKRVLTVMEYEKENPQPKDGEFGWDLEFKAESLEGKIHELKLLRAQAEIIIEGLKDND